MSRDGEEGTTCEKCKGNLFARSACINAWHLTLLFLDHALADVEGQVGGSVEHDVDDGLEGVGGEPLGRRDEVPRGIVDHHVWDAELLDDGVDGRLDGLGIADVALER